MKKFLPDPFVMLMLCMVVLALLVPWPAGDGFFIDLNRVAQIGISIVFFLHGANLEPSKLAASVRNWRAHTLIQLTTFLIFPVFGLMIFFGASGFLTPELRLGFFFLAALPSTISSSIAMTSIGRGNIPVAVFNATLSSLFGMVLTPAMIALVSVSAMGEISLIDSMIDIALTLLAPFVLGQVLRRWIAPILANHKWILTRLDRGVILLIVYVSFARSTLGGVWSQFSIAQFAVTGALVLAILGIVLVATAWISRRIGLSTEDEVSVVFCGSTKSLANGAPIAQILFAGSASMGLLMLPLMLYHQFQLIACAMIAQNYAKREEGAS